MIRNMWTGGTTGCNPDQSGIDADTDFNEFREAYTCFADKLEDLSMESPSLMSMSGFVCVDPCRDVYHPARLVEEKLKARNQEMRFRYITKPRRPPYYNRLQNK